jgi:hypothetical protein
MPSLILKRASASRPSGEWSDDDFDVLANGVVVGRIVKASAAPVGVVVAVDARLWPPRRSITDAVMSRRAKPRWQRSPSHDGAIDALRIRTKNIERCSASPKRGFVCCPSA